MNMATGSRRGAAAVEFVLAVPIIFLIATAVLDYAWFLNRSGDVLAAVREGARHGSTIDQDSDPVGEAMSRTESALAAYSLPCATGCDIEAQLFEVGGLTTIAVTARVPYEPFVGLLPTPETMAGTLTLALLDQSAP